MTRLDECTLCGKEPFRFILWLEIREVTVRCEKCYRNRFGNTGSIPLAALDRRYNSGLSRIFNTAEDLQLYVAKEHL